ncbi:hypothetical protein IF1G_10766 [Cordyceps javanica]|uniref:Uncharacterized protein n=1 Tax=Cordyceps javanica TaxID=43265 RepID=A0A545UMD3_9HYPO|nr:hypothetical protein IF1G_10766 [Cordyceps javanica]TQW02061.1 hypothetical protein IF2G_10461 [Cordyceps javanica]
MTSTVEQERQLACLSLLYEAVNETCRAGADAVYSSGATGQEESLSDTETFLCKLAQVCDSQKGGDTITALACLRGRHGLEYTICSNSRPDSELNECVKFLTKLLNYISMNPNALQPKALRKQVLWRILKFNIGRVSFYLKALFPIVAQCIDDCHRLEDGHQSAALKHLLAIHDRCNFEIDMASTENSEPLFLSSCESLINIYQDAMPKGLAVVLDSRGRMAGHGHGNWSQLRHLLGRLHSYRQAADTIIGASLVRPELFRGFAVQYVPSAAPARSLVPRGAPLGQLLRLAFPPDEPPPLLGDVDELELERAGLLQDTVSALQRRGRRGRGSRTAVHCEAQLHGYLHNQGLTSPSQFLDGSCFIATSKPPCKLCHVYFDALSGTGFRVRAPHLNMYPRWRLPDLDDADGRAEVLEDMIEQMQDDTTSLLRSRRAQWRRNDSRTDTRAGFQSALGAMMMNPHGGGEGGVSLRSGSAMSMRSQTMMDMPPPPVPPYHPSSAASATHSWTRLDGVI